ncbi:MAG: aminotransferase class III-fold pyridoxal phosphate-dependent enzyme [Isosphaeraceae bacterium]
MATHLHLDSPRVLGPLPGPRAARWLARDSAVMSPSYTRTYPLVVRRARMAMVEDVDGNRFLDFTAGIAVTNAGHCHPSVVRAVRRQAGRLIHMSGTDFYYTPQVRLAEELARLAPGDGPKRAFFTNSGAEAIEAAMKLSRYHTGRSRIIAFYKAFHGRTYGALALSASRPVHRRGFSPMVPEIQHARYGDLESVRALLNTTCPADETAAIFAEPIQGEGGYIVPPDDFLPGLRQLCDEHGILLVLDEIQSGIGRTGKFFASEHWGVAADIVCLAKGIADGLPLGAIVARSDVMDWPPGSHASTFGGNPVASAAALATIGLVERKYMANAVERGRELKDGLEALMADHPCIREVRGLGLMIGMEIARDGQPDPDLRDRIIDEAFHLGLLLLPCGASTVRFCPPLCLTARQVRTGLELAAWALDRAAAPAHPSLRLSMTTTIATPTGPADFAWRRHPEAEALIAELAREALEACPFASNLADRMARETSTRFVDWLDHLAVPERDGLASRIEAVGYEPDPLAGAGVYQHPGGIFPRLIPGDGKAVEAAIMVESIAAFSRAHDLGLTIEGYPMGPYRVARIGGRLSAWPSSSRRGYRGFETYSGEMNRIGRMVPHAAREALAAREIFEGRRRWFESDEEGFDRTDALIEQGIDRAGSVDLACHLFFEAERAYWQSRNRAAQAQKARQDRLGLGWANHDHHTYRSSRQFFPRLMKIFRRLGFRPRERFHAGPHAGWGAQVLEHPTTGIVIFADLDLAPDEATEDFTRLSLPPLPTPNTVGLWVGLHGESILEAGMHHLEAQFDFDALRTDLEAEAGIATMKPFSDFPFLRQAFTEGERWPVSKHRADRLLALGWIDAEQHARFVAEGAIGSHLENLERREGYKGFNQQAVSAIIAATDPRHAH